MVDELVLGSIGKNIDIVDNIPERYSNGIISEQHTIIIRSLGIESYSLLLFLQYEIGYKSIQKQIRGIGQLNTGDLGNIAIPNKVINFECNKEIKSLVTSGLKKSRESLEKLGKAKGILEESIEKEYLDGQ